MARQAGACLEGQAWLDEYSGPDPWGDCPRISWVLWAAGHGLLGCPPARLDACAAARPWTALEHAAALLTPDRLDACKQATRR